MVVPCLIACVAWWRQSLGAFQLRTPMRNNDNNNGSLIFFRLAFVATHIAHLRSPIFWGESKLAPHERYSFDGLFSRRCSPIRCLLFNTMILPSERWTDYRCIRYHRYREWHCCYISRVPHPPASVFGPASHKPHDPQHHCFQGTSWYCHCITHKIQLSFFLRFRSDTESRNLCTMHSYRSLVWWRWDPPSVGAQDFYNPEVAECGVIRQCIPVPPPDNRYAYSTL